MKKELKIIYKRNTNGSINQWQIFVDDNSYYTEEGILEGKITKSKSKIIKGKNIGRSNETTDFEQACKEAESKYTKKTDSGYTEEINKVDTAKKFFSPMLAHKYIDYKDKVEFPLLCQGKCDGHRLIAMKDGLFTRNGKKYVSCPHISEILKPFFKKHPNWIIDGEIYTHEENFEKICSIVRKSTPTNEDLEESKKTIQLWIFDCITDNINMGFKERYDLIKTEILNIVGKNKNIIFVNNFIVDNHSEIVKLHDEFIKQGFEGIIIRVSNSSYENKRSKNLLKYKKFLDEEFEIIDIIEGKGNRSLMAGSLKIKTKDNKIFNSGIRGGEEYYRYLLKNKKKFIGKLATIRYQGLSSEGIPRFPVAVNIGREDI